MKGEGVRGRGGAEIGPDRRLADDGKRLDEVRVALGVALLAGGKKISLDRGGVWGGEGQLFRRIRGWRMTGSA